MENRTVFEYRAYFGKGEIIVRLALNHESAIALKTIADKSATSINQIEAATLKLKLQYEALKENLGVHAKDFKELISLTENAIKKANSSIDILVPKIYKTSEDIENYVKRKLEGKAKQNISVQGSKTVQANVEPNSSGRVRSMHRDLNNPNLFKENVQGQYTYSKSENGKQAYGSLKLGGILKRNNKIQKNIGGASKLYDDDGGHIIGYRFAGSSGEENIEAQNRNLNRGSYKILENCWEKALRSNKKVFVNVETPHDTEGDRPDAYMGYSIIESPDGKREWEAFSYTNASKKEQEGWNKELVELSDSFDDYYNPMEETYEQELYVNDLDDV